jgi:alcohol dehydrogenase class IV
MQSFLYQALPMRVLFGPGSLARLPAEVDHLGAHRALVLCTPEQVAQAERVAALLGERSAGVFPKAVMHVPIEAAREAREVARQRGADCAVAIGGGSTTGLGKAIALESGLPIVAIPTGRDVRVLPRSVIYDPELTLTLPLGMTVTSAFNAIAHAAEGLYAHDGNPIVSMMAEEGIRASAAALLPLTANPRDLEARGDALYGAWLCGSVLGAVSMGLHHKLCHTLGGSFNLPHAEVHTVILPHVLAYNAAHAPEAMERVSRALGATDAARTLFDLSAKYGAPTSLRMIGMPQDGLDRAADLAVQTPYPNPRPLDRAALRALLQRAFDGAPPEA